MSMGATRGTRLGHGVRWYVPLVVGVSLLGWAWQAPAAEPPSAVPPPTEAPHPVTLAECVGIALQNQPSIQAQQAALGAAVEVKKQAQSYYWPQINFSTKYTALERPLVETAPNPLAGPLAGVLADSAAFFSIAKQAGSAAALQALGQPGLPPFGAIRQAALGAFPTTFDIQIFGDSLWYSEVAITQPLYTGGKIRYRNQQAGLGIQVAGADLNKVRQQTIFDVHRAYYGVLLAQELVRVAEDTAGQYRALEKLGQGLVDSGDEFVTVADVHRAKAIRLLADNQKIEFECAGDLARAALRQVMGLPPLTPLALADDRLVLKKTAIDQAQALDQALAKRPELLKAEVGVRNAELQEKLARAQFQPNVGMFGTLSTLTGNRSFPNPGKDELWQLGVGAQVPLFTGGRNLAENRKAHHQLQQARETLRLARDLIGLEVQQVYLEYQEAAQRLPLAEAAVAESKAALKSYHDQYTANLIADKDVPKYFENVATGRLLLFTAEARYNQHVFTYNLAVAQLRLVTATDE